MKSFKYMFFLLFFLLANKELLSAGDVVPENVINELVNLQKDFVSKRLTADTLREQVAHAQAFNKDKLQSVQIALDFAQQARDRRNEAEAVYDEQYAAAVKQYGRLKIEDGIREFNAAACKKHEDDIIEVYAAARKKHIIILGSSVVVALAAAYATHLYNQRYCIKDDQKKSVIKMAALFGGATAMFVAAWQYGYFGV